MKKHHGARGEVRTCKQATIAIYRGLLTILNLNSRRVSDGYGKETIFESSTSGAHARERGEVRSKQVSKPRRQHIAGS